MKSISRPILPQIPPGVDLETRRWMESLTRALQAQFQAQYEDLEQGNAKLMAYTVAPETTDLAEGQMAVRTDAGNEKIYVKVAGTIMSTALT